MYRNRAVRRAFTIVELLVVIAIIGVLIGLLLPAVNMARESGRRAACSNNLKQLGLAMLQYEELNKIFPINWGTLVDTATPPRDILGRNSLGHSWLTGILAFLEEKQIYDTIKFGQPLSANLAAARQPVVEFACPSDAGERVSTIMEPLNTEDAANTPALSDTDKQLGVTNYKACAGMNWRRSVNPRRGSKREDTRIYAKLGRNSGDPNTITVGTTAPPQPDTYEFDHGNGITCRGCLKFKDSNGVTITTPLYTTADRDIKDGRSKTFAIGESVPSWCPYSAWYSYEGATATCGVPLNFIAVIGSRGDPDPNKAYYKDYYSRSFASYHPGGANFCMCDGSVMFIKDDITLQQKDTDFGYLMCDTTNGYLIIPPGSPAPISKFIPGAYMNMATIDGGELVQPQK